MMGTGTVVNAVAIAAGGALGLLAGRGIKVRYQETVIHGLSLCVMVLGLKMALAGQHTLFVISGLVLGILVGEALNIEGKLEQVGLYLGKRFSQKGETGAFAKGFLTTSLIYCVGAMAIVGSIQDGLNGDASTLYTKAMIDGLSAIMYGANMGAGVMASALSVFFYQGTLTLLSSFIGPFVTDAVAQEISAAGGILIFGIGLTMSKIITMRVGNMIPGLFIVAVMTYFLDRNEDLSISSLRSIMDGYIGVIAQLVRAHRSHR